MATWAKETACSDCGHREVCSLKERFCQAQTAVDNVNVNLGPSPDGHGTSFIKLSSIEFIEPVVLRCKHFCRSEKYREGENQETIRREL